MSVLPPQHDMDISVRRVVYSFHFPPFLDANKSHGNCHGKMDGINSIILSVTSRSLPRRDRGTRYYSEELLAARVHPLVGCAVLECFSI